MAARLSGLIAALAALTAAAAMAQGAAPAALSGATPGREIVTREAILRAGVLRLGEVVRLAVSWNAFTVDDYAWRAAPAASGAVAEDRWMVLVDGRPASPGVLGINSLERLPLDIAVIDSVVFESAPGLAAGRVTGDGVVRIYTRRPHDGISARGRLAFGSETGDPGPFVFLPDGGRNRDRYGHDLAAGAGYGRDGWYLDGAMASAVHFPTDPRIFRRLAAGAFLPPRIERTAGAVRLGRDGPAGGHHILAGASRLDDRLRLELAGSEIPVRTTLTHLSGNGAVALDRFALRYHAGFEDARAATRPDATLPPFDYEWRTLRAGVELADRSTASRRFGVALVRQGGTRDDSVSMGRELDLRAFAEFGWNPSERVRQSASVSLGGRGDGLAGGAVVAQSIGLPSAGTVTLQLFVSRHRAVTDFALLDLAARGDRWLESAGVPPGLQDFDGMSTEAGALLGWERRMERATASAAAYLRGHRDVLAVDRALQWDADLHAWRGPALAEPTSGRVAGLEMAAELLPSSRVRFRARYRLAGAFGDPLFRRMAERNPRHRGIISASWQPVPAFGMDGIGEFRSSGVWAEYRDTRPAPGKARPVVEGNFSLSATVWKTFMGGRLRGEITGRNVTGARIIHHPEGSAAGLAFFVLLGADL